MRLERRHASDDSGKEPARSALRGGCGSVGYTTKTDLSGWGSFLIMGVIGIIVAAVVNLFLQSNAVQFAISVIGVLVFAGLTAYDTQRIKGGYYQFQGDATAVAKGAIMGALSLYLDFINMFTFLLQLFGRPGGKAEHLRRNSQRASRMAEFRRSCPDAGGVVPALGRGFCLSSLSAPRIATWGSPGAGRET